MYILFYTYIKNKCRYIAYIPFNPVIIIDLTHDDRLCNNFFFSHHK